MHSLLYSTHTHTHVFCIYVHNRRKEPFSSFNSFWFFFLFWIYCMLCVNRIPCAQNHTSFNNELMRLSEGPGCSKIVIAIDPFDRWISLCVCCVVCCPVNFFAPITFGKEVAMSIKENRGTFDKTLSADWFFFRWWLY